MRWSLLAVVIGRFKLPHITSAEGGHAVVKDDSIWKHPNLVMGAIGIFTYVGAEVAIGSFLVNYLHEPNHRRTSTLETAAKSFPSIGCGAMVGRFIGSCGPPVFAAAQGAGCQCVHCGCAGLPVDGDQRATLPW